MTISLMRRLFSYSTAAYLHLWRPFFRISYMEGSTRRHKVEIRVLQKYKYGEQRMSLEKQRMVKIFANMQKIMVLYMY